MTCHIMETIPRPSCSFGIILDDLTDSDHVCPVVSIRRKRAQFPKSFYMYIATDIVWDCIPRIDFQTSHIHERIQKKIYI